MTKQEPGVLMVTNSAVARSGESMGRFPLPHHVAFYFNDPVHSFLVTLETPHNTAPQRFSDTELLVLETNPPLPSCIDNY